MCMCEGKFMYVCMCVCLCVLCAVVYACAMCVGGRSSWHNAAFSKCHSKPLIVCGFRCVCVCVVCVCLHVCAWACVCVCVCVLKCVLSLCAWQKHDMIRVPLETIHLKWEILFLTCTMWSMVIIVIWPLFRKMSVNHCQTTQPNRDILV